MNQLIEQWQSRSPRERLTLGIGGVLALFLVFYLAIWDPIQSDRARLARDIPKLRAQAEQFRRDADEADVLRARAKGRASASQPLPAALEASLRRANLGTGLKPVQSLGSDRAQVSGAASFDGLVRWMGAAAQDDGLSVESLQAAAAGEGGRVQIDSLGMKR